MKEYDIQCTSLMQMMSDLKEYSTQVSINGNVRNCAHVTVVGDYTVYFRKLLWHFIISPTTRSKHTCILNESTRNTQTFEIVDCVLFKYNSFISYLFSQRCGSDPCAPDICFNVSKLGSLFYYSFLILLLHLLQSPIRMYKV